MTKHEAKFTSKFVTWLLYNGEDIIGKSFPWEAKISVGDKPINFKSGFRPHQIPTLIQARDKVHAYKVSDMDQMSKPFDGTFFCKAPSYIVMHWVRNGNKTFYLINPKQIALLIEQGYKSLTEVMAESICDYKGEVR